MVTVETEMITEKIWCQRKNMMNSLEGVCKIENGTV